MHPIPFPIFQPILSPPPLLFPSSSTTSSITSNREGRARGSSGGGGCSGGRMKERLCCPPSPPPSPAVLSFPSSSITSSITSTREGRARGSSGAAVARDGGGLRTTEPFLPPSSAPSPPRSPLLLFPQFLYYLIDRFYQGGQSEGQQRWRGMVEDFGASMDVGDGHVVETMVMVMVDECTEEGLKEACSLIPHLISLSSPSSSSSSSSAPPIHPRIARVLIERGKPEPALQILRACSPGPAIFQACSTPGSATPVFPNLAVPLEEAVTALRVLIENRLLTEAFLYLRAYCKQLSINDPSSPQPLADAPDSADAADGSDATVSAAVGSADNEAAKSAYTEAVDVLVSELFWLAVRHQAVPEVLAFPWRGREGAVLQCCLLTRTAQQPEGACGTLLVLFHVERARYKAALSAHKQVWAIEAAVEAEQESEEANNEDEEGRQERGSEDGEKEEGGSPMDATAGAAAVGTAGADVVAKGASRKRRRGGKGLTVQLREKRIRLL
ncbi:unnamed protein product, partial [Closterium sp. NIES-54]